MVSYTLCNRWINEVRGWRCDRMHGHEGKCRTLRQSNPTPDEVNGQARPKEEK